MKRELLGTRWVGLVGVAIFSVSWISECTAAPLLLRGTATIATIYDDYEYEGTVRRLPFAAQLGDSFQFYLSIESQPLEPGRPSGFVAFRSTIGGVQLEHNELEVVVRNDSGVALLTLAVPRVVDMMAIEGDGIYIRRDYRLGTTDYAGTTDRTGGLKFGLDLGFLEYDLAGRLPYPAILNNVSIPQNASTWQAFSDREIALLFENSTFVGAYINDIVVVPEPSAAVAAGIGWSLIVLCFRLARRQRDADGTLSQEIRLRALPQIQCNAGRKGQKHAARFGDDRCAKSTRNSSIRIHYELTARRRNLRHTGPLV